MKKAEIKVAAFIVEPFRVMDHLSGPPSRTPKLHMISVIIDETTKTFVKRSWEVKTDIGNLPLWFIITVTVKGG